MPNDSAFKRLALNPGTTVSLWVEGQQISALSGESVAAALFAAGLGPTRTTPVSLSPRAAYCMMGVCFECLLVIDGRPNTQGCMTAVAEGMRVGFQQGARDPGSDSEQPPKNPTEAGL